MSQFWRAKDIYLYTQVIGELNTALLFRNKNEKALEIRERIA
jgi:hypothetical protein